MTIGIISAMPEEIYAFTPYLQKTKSTTKGMRTYVQGELFGKNVVMVFSRWGKVAAATTVTQLINDFVVDEIIFTGVAGAITNNLNIGDIVIGKKLYQHDMDASPILPKYEIPLLKKSFFETDEKRRLKMEKAVKSFLQEFNLHINSNSAKEFKITKPSYFVGDIASGDEFINQSTRAKQIKIDLPDVMAVEMEGAAVAQVCYEYCIPFSIIRTISDNANDNAFIDFPAFIKNIASYYAFGIIKYYLA